MEQEQLVTLLGEAFANGKNDALAPWLAVDCVYQSDYANIRMTSGAEIISRMKQVYARIDENNRYTYRVVKLAELLSADMKSADLDFFEDMHFCKYGLLLYQYNDQRLAAVVMVMIDERGKICDITLSRDSNCFDVDFYDESVRQEKQENALQREENERQQEAERLSSEPELCEAVIFEDEQFLMKKLWHWDVRALFEDEETGLMKGVLSGQTFNYEGRSAFCTPEGKRCSDLVFDYIDHFCEGLALVQPVDSGFGYVDETMEFKIQPEYEAGEAFKNGLAKVKKDGVWHYVDRSGKALFPLNSRNYKKICDFSEGLCRVSTFEIDMTDLAYESEYYAIAGVWGYINEKGEEVISPQYIYANDFESGIAIVCKGQWTQDEKWDTEYRTGAYWSEEALWGAIDGSGREIIPCKFDDIKCFQGTREAFIAHYGGWEYGKWGVIDREGNWLAEPFFEDIDQAYRDGLFAFYEDDRWSCEDVLMGIFDLTENRLLFEPQFYGVNFLEDGAIKVQVFDEVLNRKIEKLIDMEGKTLFDSVYTFIRPLGNFYEVVIREENDIQQGLIEKDGKVIFLSQNDIPWDSISVEMKRFVFVRNGMQGVKTFDGEELIAPLYYGITGLEEPLLIICAEVEDGCKEGLFTQEGKMIVPPIYDNIIRCRDGRYICSGNDGCDVLQLLIK